MGVRKRNIKRSGKVSTKTGTRRRIPELVEDASDGLTRNLAWKAKATDSPQVKGRKEEKKYLKEKGVRLHPNSGALSIKYDGSTEHSIVEMKDASKSYAMTAKYVGDLFKHASKQSKDAILIIQFPEHIVECAIVRRRK